MVALFAVAGYQVGNVAVARSVAAVDFGFRAEPEPPLRKGSLFSTEPLIEPLTETVSPVAQEPVIRASLVPAKSDILVETRTVRSKDALASLSSPPIALIEENRQKGLALRREVAEHRCLSRAIYFEARSESEVGRLAVAKVILNRVQSPFYPDTICDVVYQNAEKLNACQFSFACDGKSDRPGQARAWQRAKTLASRAIAGEGEVKAIATATHYHADYVQPKWSGAMTRLVKIGRHIFYSGS